MGNIYKSDCRYFVGDRPCVFHKAEGVKCAQCSTYDAPQMRILIVKLGAMGDVLRTTSFLPTIHSHYGNPHVTWVTQKESVALFGSNPMVDGVMACGSETLARLQIESFDLVINPEASRESAALAAIANGEEKRGYGLSSNGAVFPFNESAADIFPLGLFDDLKKENDRTYEQFICHLAEIPYERVQPLLFIEPEEIAAAKTSCRRAGIRLERPVVALNTGGGGRWRFKRWTLQGFIDLAGELNQRLGAQIMLLGGPGEAGFNQALVDALGDIAVDAGCDNPVRHFAALVNCCDVLVTGDSLALHVGLAMKKRIVALFGPTSAAEIDLYGSGEKVAADLDCLCCYLPNCDKAPNCMESISVETVYQAVRRQLDYIDNPHKGS